MRNQMKKVLLILLIIFLIYLPLVVKSQYILSLMITLFIYVILAESWNLLGGYTGQVSLGHGAFFGVGALVTRLPSPAGVKAGAVQDDLAPAVACLHFQCACVELEQRGIVVVELFRHT